MEQRIRDRYHAGLLTEAARRYSIVTEIRPVDAFESFIFEFDTHRGEFILRLSHCLRRTEALIRGEIDWINYLAAGGATVARAVPSEGGNLVEAIDDGWGGAFLATAFEKADGVKPRQAGWTSELYTTYGRLLGRMHALTKDYVPARPQWRRPQWDDDVFEFVDRYLPADERIARDKYRAVLEHIRTLPRDPASYGLVHQDAHGANLHVNQRGVLTLFDFDDCGYNWFGNDIAIVLFYMAMGPDNTPAFTREFMSHFLSGYRQENTLEGWWLREIPSFLKVREIELYAVMFRDFDVDNIDDEWCAAYMLGRKQRIEDDVPYVDYKFDALNA